MARCALLFAFLALLSQVNGAKILAVLPMYATSHFRMMQPLLFQLADSGHEVTVLSFYPLSKPRPNYIDIDLSSIHEPYHLDPVEWNVFADIYDLFSYSTEAFEQFLASEQVQNLLKSGQQFDLIILEAFAFDAVLGFPAFFKAPYIAFSTMALPPWLADWNWNPVESSFVPDHMCRESGVDVISRGYRYFCQAFARAFNYWYNKRPSPHIVNKYFGLELDSLDDMKANLSVMFVNTVSAIGGVRPYFPNVIEVGGIHITPKKPLSDELSQWIDTCTKGVVLFSMGSLIQASSLDSSVRDSLVDILGRLDECVLWKWETPIEKLPANIRIMPWLQQADVLAHPNVRAFISHGGFHGLMEAVFYGVPIVGIPFFGDQMTNIDLLKMKGVAVATSLAPFSAAEFESAVQQVLKNSSYFDNAKKLSRLVRDADKTPLETAVWWTEYVLRHNGAPHFRHTGINLTWWQYYNLDMFLIAAAVILIVKRFLRA